MRCWWAGHHAFQRLPPNPWSRRVAALTRSRRIASLVRKSRRSVVGGIPLVARSAECALRSSWHVNAPNPTPPTGSSNSRVHRDRSREPAATSARSRQVRGRPMSSWRRSLGSKSYRRRGAVQSATFVTHVEPAPPPSRPTSCRRRVEARRRGSGKQAPQRCWLRSPPRPRFPSPRWGPHPNRCPARID